MSFKFATDKSDTTSAPYRTGVIEPKSSIQQREPVLLAFIAGSVPVLAAFTLQILEVTDILDNATWLRVLLTGLGPLVGTLSALWARANVVSPATMSSLRGTRYRRGTDANLPNTPDSSDLGTFGNRSIGKPEDPRARI
jgi:hypothetical protein